MKEGIDIYQYKEWLENEIRNLNKSEISKRNKELIIEFQRYAALQNISLARQLRYVSILRSVSKHLGKDLDKAEKKDIERVVGIIHGLEITAWTKCTYKVMIKRFYKWLKGNDEEYPPEVRWVKTTLKRSDEKLPSEGDLLNEGDIIKLIENAEHPRDKALVSMLFESGCRVGEIGSLQIGKIEFDKYGTVINVNGKTGPRKLRLISSTPHIASWLKFHPFKDDKKAPVWICTGNTHHNQTMKYSAISVLLKRLFKKAGIDKKSNPHFLRHSRATYMANHLTEFQMNQYFGWTQGSRMPSVYVHLSGKETDKAIFEMNGIKIEKEIKESELKPKKCFRCDTINSSESKFCSKCAGILDMKTAIELEERRKEENESRKSSDSLMDMLIKDEEFRNMLMRKMNQLGLKNGI